MEFVEVLLARKLTNLARQLSLIFTPKIHPDTSYMLLYCVLSTYTLNCVCVVDFCIRVGIFFANSQLAERDFILPPFVRADRDLVLLAIVKVSPTCRTGLTG